MCLTICIITIITAGCLGAKRGKKDIEELYKV